MNLQDELSDHFTRLAEVPAPPCAVDLDRAADAGRRARTARHARQIGGVVGVLAATTAAVLSVALQSGLGAAPSAAAPPSASPSAASTPSPAGLTGTDPLAVGAGFEPLPRGWLVSSIDIQDGTQYTTVTNGAAGESAELTLPPPAGQRPGAPHNTGGGPADAISTQPVGAAPAYWYWEPGSAQLSRPGEMTLEWQLTTDQWATLDFTSSDMGAAITPAVYQAVYQLAESVRLKDPISYPLPLHFTPPVALPFSSASYNRSANGSWSAQVSYGTPDSSANIGGNLSISLADAAADAAAVPSPAWPSASTSTTVVNGCTVTLSSRKNAAELNAPDCDGLDINIEAAGTAFRLLQTNGGLAVFFRTVSLLGPNPANWTTHVIG